ncbi:MAG: hypothetical protein LBQ78_08105 [Tannerellaceae bacterium]|jgi:hypothetical protein|nr:hypothetical protein [Tannerellaceae bacterium]
MGFIREPEGVDFVINSQPLTDKDRAEISQYIRNYKAKAAENTMGNEIPNIQKKS